MRYFPPVAQKSSSLSPTVQLMRFSLARLRWIVWRAKSRRHKLVLLLLTSLLAWLLVLLYGFRKSVASRPFQHLPRVKSNHILRRRSTVVVERALSRSQDVETDRGRIPKIIHQTWKSPVEIPETFRPWITSWLSMNPDWDYWMWSDEDIRKFISSDFPDYLELFDSYPSHAYRVDIFRYFVLYAYGGIYVDLDMECLRTISGYFDNLTSSSSPVDCILSQEPIEHGVFLGSVGVPLVSNALMACRKQHPFFQYVISGLSRYQSGNSWLPFLGGWNDVLSATGPYMLTRAYHGYTASETTADQSIWSWLTTLVHNGAKGPSDPLWKNITRRVQLAAADDFQPTPDDSMVDYMRQQCIEKREKFRRESSSRKRDGDQATFLISKVCDRMTAYDFGRSRPDSSRSWTLHHWTHSWVGRRNDPWGLLNELMHRFSITELFEEIVRT